MRQAIVVVCALVWVTGCTGTEAPNPPGIPDGSPATFLDAGPVPWTCESGCAAVVDAWCDTRCNVCGQCWDTDYDLCYSGWIAECNRECIEVGDVDECVERIDAQADCVNPLQWPNPSCYWMFGDDGP